MRRTVWCVVASWLVVVAPACGSDEVASSTAEGDPCEQDGDFACTGAPGDHASPLLVCEGGSYRVALECGDAAQGCFVENGGQQGRCFHGDGTGQVCQYTGQVDCCAFNEPNLACQ